MAMNALYAAEMLAADESEERRQVVMGLVDRRRVTGVAAVGYYETVSLDPLVGGSLTFPALKGAQVDIGDDVVLLAVGGSYVILGALPGVGGEA